MHWPDAAALSRPRLADLVSGLPVATAHRADRWAITSATRQLVHPRDTVADFNKCVQLPMAPKEAPCQQTHRLQLFSGERLVFESTQHISGIPMGDLFKVEARYDVTNCGTPQSPQCQVSLQGHMQMFPDSACFKDLPSASGLGVLHASSHEGLAADAVELLSALFALLSARMSRDFCPRPKTASHAGQRW